MGIAQLARKFGQAILPVRISVSGLAVSPEGYRGEPSPRIPPPRASREIACLDHMLELEFVERTDVGRVRDHNEDYLGHASPATPAQARTHGWLFVLADGVGGHEKGEVASRAAVESMIAGFRKAKDGEPHTALLPRLVQQANTHVFETAVAGGRDFGGHGHDDGRLRVAVRPGDGGPRGRFALLFDPQWQGGADHARSHGRQRAGAAGPGLRARSRRRARRGTSSAVRSEPN